MLAAGVGRRLGRGDSPKVLLSFGGASLLQRHLQGLAEAGVGDLSITVGHGAAAVQAAAGALSTSLRVSFVDNPRYREGSLLSLWVQRDRLRAGRPVLLMDADVLCDGRMFRALFGGVHENTLLLDREIEPGDEPVKICVARDGGIVDFRKVPDRAGEWRGESVGFFLFSADGAAALADRLDSHVSAGMTGVEYEEAIRDLLLAEPHRFGFVDVTDLPWTEIDFEADVTRAEQVILPQLEAAHVS
jgi:choline kinase